MIQYNSEHPKGIDRGPRQKTTLSPDSILFIGAMDLPPVKSWRAAAEEGKKTRDLLKEQNPSKERL